jgi:hypothetical protein
MFYVTLSLYTSLANAFLESEQDYIHTMSVSLVTDSYSGGVLQESLPGIPVILTQVLHGFFSPFSQLFT